MDYPILAPGDSWYKSEIDKGLIRDIEIVDSMDISAYSIVWNADVNDTGSIKCALAGINVGNDSSGWEHTGYYYLYIIGNGSGKIALNEDSQNLFKDFSSTIASTSWGEKEYFNKLTITGLELLDVSNCTNLNYAFANTKLKTINIPNWNFTEETSLANMFNNCALLTTINIGNWDTSKVTNFEGMFYNCPSLTEIDETKFNTSSAIDLSYMFYKCTALEELNFSSWNTSNVTNIAGMFTSCETLTSLDITGWNTSNVTNMYGLFNCTYLLESVAGLNNLVTSNVTNMSRMFAYTKITPPYLDTSKVTDIAYMFMGYQGETLYFPDWDMSNVTSMNAIFAQPYGKGNLKSIYNFNLNANVFPLMTDKLKWIFVEAPNITTLDMSKWDITGFTDLSALFYGLSSITTLDVSNWDVSSAYTIDSMFENCSSLKNLDVSNWNVSNVTDMSFMFYSCSSLKEIDVSKWDVSKCKNFDHFAAHAYLKRKGIENWDTSSAENMNAMFHATGETELDLSGFKTSKVKYFSQMFEASTNLKRIKGLEKWDTSQATGFDEMFGRCYALEELDLSSWDTSKAKNGDKASTNGHTTGTFRNFINDCRSLKKLVLGPNFKVNGDSTNTNASYRLVLPTPSTDYHPAANGYWYDEENNQYSPTGIEDGARTYYSSPFYAHMANMTLVKKTTISKIIDSIRAKTGKQEKMKISAVPNAIDGIVGGLGGEKALIEKTFTEYSNDTVVNVKDHIFRSCTNLTTLDLPNAESIGYYSISMCPNLTSINLPKVKTISADGFRADTNLQTLDLPLVESIGNTAFVQCAKLNTLILRNNVMCVIGATPFTSTPIESGTGYIYVPAALIDSYKAADNWSTYTNQFRALESYTVDGTVTGALDSTKI